MARYNLGHDVPFRAWTDTTGRYRDGTTIPDKLRDAFRPIHEIVYNHFVRRRGLAMPHVLEVLKRIRTEGFERDEQVFRSLLFHD